MRIIYSWDEFETDIKTIQSKIIASNYNPDYIVGIKRGGLVPAVKLSHLLNKPMILISCQLRDNNDHEIKMLEAEQLPRNKNILIIDDICDAGETLHKITVEFMKNQFCNVKTCVLYHNTAQKFHTDYYAKTINRSKDERWIHFPWDEGF